MSRSKRRTPICGITTAASDKIGKVFAHRRHRRACTVAVVTGSDLPDERLHYDPWLLPKDGKQWIPEEYREEGMRK